MIENTSGHGEFTEVPDEINKWNWGAFWLTWIWGIGNKSYIAFLALLPVANIVMPFYLGKKGNELAWKNNRFYDTEEFHRTQKKWAIAGWIISILFISAIIGNEIDSYQKAKESERIAEEIMKIVMEDTEAKKLFGNEFEIISKGSHGAKVSGVDKIMGYLIIIKKNNEAYLINANINDGKQITSIEITKFGNDGEPDITILNE